MLETLFARIDDQGAALRVHMPDAEAVHEMSAAAIELTRVIQSLDDLCAALDALAASPRQEAVIHGDIEIRSVAGRSKKASVATAKNSAGSVAPYVSMSVRCPVSATR